MATAGFDSAEPVVGQLQAALYNSRERLSALAFDDPDLYRTHSFPIPTPLIDAAVIIKLFGDVTFSTGIRITGVAPAGLIFEYGSATTAAAMWIDGDTLNFRAGGTGINGALATYTYPTTFPVGLEASFVFGLRSGVGKVRIWNNGLELARDDASAGIFPSGWAESSDGAFAAAAQGALPGDVTQTGAPVDFELTRPMSVYLGQRTKGFS